MKKGVNMVCLKKILLPTGFPDFAPYGLNEGIALARRCRSEFSGLHVIDQGMINAPVNMSAVS
jgi:hypothetical protein